MLLDQTCQTNKVLLDSDVTVFVEVLTNMFGLYLNCFYELFCC
jgi:hypothetical protein